MARTTHCYLHAMLTNWSLMQRVFKAADWSGLYVKICDIIPYNPDQ